MGAWTPTSCSRLQSEPLVTRAPYLIDSAPHQQPQNQHQSTSTRTAPHRQQHITAPAAASNQQHRTSSITTLHRQQPPRGSSSTAPHYHSTFERYLVVKSYVTAPHQQQHSTVPAAVANQQHRTSSITAPNQHQHQQPQCQHRSTSSRAALHQQPQPHPDSRRRQPTTTTTMTTADDDERRRAGRRAGDSRAAGGRAGRRRAGDGRTDGRADVLANQFEFYREASKTVGGQPQLNARISNLNLSIFASWPKPNLIYTNVI